MKTTEEIIEATDPTGANKVVVESLIEVPKTGGRGQQNNYRGQYQGSHR